MSDEVRAEILVTATKLNLPVWEYLSVASTFASGRPAWEHHDCWVTWGALSDDDADAEWLVLDALFKVPICLETPRGTATMTLIQATKALADWVGPPSTRPVPRSWQNDAPTFILAFWTGMHQEGYVACDESRGVHVLLTPDGLKPGSSNGQLA